MASMSPIRLVARDGACLLFDRRDGTQALVRGPSTAALRARAPRTVMFAPSHACNLRCHFCSRDAELASTWDERSAFDFLASMAELGVLEVAFGGGEPLAFRGLDALLARLREETPLALHLTTNAVLLDDTRLARLRPLVAEIRVSIYDDTPWPERIAALASTPGAFGANVLVTADRVAALPALLARLEALGCPDVALLRYVGPDASLALDARHSPRIAAAALRTSMRTRASVCFGDTLGLPTLRTTGASDCGAGADFVTIGPDRTVRACSFAKDAIPFVDASDVVEIWSRERDRLTAALAMHGCARDQGTLRSEPESKLSAHGPPPGPRATRASVRERSSSHSVHVWRAFAGNNSGDCFLVGRFERSDEARDFVASLREGHAPQTPLSDAWRARFAAAGIIEREGEHMPERLEAVGRTVLAHTESAVEDDFPSLRELLWSAGGRAHASAIHEHDPVLLLSAIAPIDARQLDSLDPDALFGGLSAAVRRGDVLYGIREIEYQEAPDFGLAALRERAGSEPAAELVRLPIEHPYPSTPETRAATQEATSPAALGRLLTRALAKPRPAEGEWLLVRTTTAEQARQLAARLNPSAVTADRWVLLHADTIGARTGRIASQLGSGAHLIEGRELRVDVGMWRPDRSLRGAPAVDADRVVAELRAELGGEARIESHALEWKALRLVLHTAAPLTVLPFVAAFARARGLELWLDPSTPEPLAQAAHRLDVDVRALRRERR